jgi:disulfide bond formation protein DsbB
VSTAAVSTFLGLLALVALVGVVGVAAVAALDAAGPARGMTDGLRRAMSPIGLWLAFVVALTAMAGSLYFSEVAGFVPCALCWYQRIAMYPLVLLLGVAAVRRDTGIVRYAVPLAAIGALVSIWHIGVERIPSLPSGSCSLEVSCSTIYVQVLGFVTIPTMALAAFGAIITLLVLVSGSRREGSDTLEEATA